MLRNLYSLRTSPRVTLAAAAVLLIGCSGKEAGTDNARAESASGNVAAGADTGALAAAPIGTGTGAAAAAPARTREMPARWETISPEAFEAYVDGLEFDNGGGKKDVPRSCKAGGPSCANANPRGRTKVDIDPEEGAISVGPGNIAPNGHVVARLRNKGPGTEAKYSLPRGEWVYWLVTPGQGGGPDVSRFVWIDGSEKAKVKRVASTYRYSPCPPHGDGSKASEADFKHCPQALTATETTPADTQAILADHPGWISCTRGCCVASIAIQSLTDAPRQQ